MPKQRIRGQETTVTITRDGNVEAELTAIQNFKSEAVAETKAMGYLGEQSERTDDIFKHHKGEFELHLTDAKSWTEFKKAVKDRQTRRTPDIVISIAFTKFFPNGDVTTSLFPDVKIGPIPEEVGSREDYLKSKIEFITSDLEETNE